MSAAAMHRVLTYGPVDDHRLILVLLNVADWPDTDINDRGHPVSQVTVAARSHISLWWCRDLMARAVDNGWLAQPARPRPGRPGLWKLGPNLAEPRGATATPSRSPRTKTKATSRSPRTDLKTDGDVDDVSGGSPAHLAEAAPPSFEDTHVPPAANGHVEKVDPVISETARSEAWEYLEPRNADHPTVRRKRRE